MRTSKEKLVATTKENVSGEELEIVSFSQSEDYCFAVCLDEKGYLKEFKIDDLEMVGYAPISR